MPLLGIILGIVIGAAAIDLSHASLHGIEIFDAVVIELGAGIFGGVAFSTLTK